MGEFHQAIDRSQLGNIEFQDFRNIVSGFFERLHAIWTNRADRHMCYRRLLRSPTRRQLVTKLQNRVDSNCQDFKGFGGLPILLRV
ncbi:MAG: hypothetical protein DMG87_17150 [Acidobacteria bacterium]|nr:MAG: hypothetical protein DMG87_17150 [Acidobacteriota bacterium]